MAQLLLLANPQMVNIFTSPTGETWLLVFRSTNSFSPETGWGQLLQNQESRFFSESHFFCSISLVRPSLIGWSHHIFPTTFLLTFQRSLFYSDFSSSLLSRCRRSWIFLPFSSIAIEMVGFEATCTWLRRLIPGFLFSFPSGTWVRYAMSTIQIPERPWIHGKASNFVSLVRRATSIGTPNNHDCRDGIDTDLGQKTSIESTRILVRKFTRRKSGCIRETRLGVLVTIGTASTKIVILEISWGIYEGSATGPVVRFVFLCNLTFRPKNCQRT